MCVCVWGGGGGGGLDSLSQSRPALISDKFQAFILFFGLSVARAVRKTVRD